MSDDDLEAAAGRTLDYVAEKRREPSRHADRARALRAPAPLRGHGQNTDDFER